jgi:hypothetical protein
MPLPLLSVSTHGSTFSLSDQCSSCSLGCL